ncbi:hypothetical protein [Methylobacterium sp. Leaf86]|uniref:hypothetical protein n=1 Tax=Methylobacterium sp. Leaf86 TaxID=1736242 RepID=UPI0012E88F46|nr:hypothetical protein [Methylobacterium sp. Leaf86]
MLLAEAMERHSNMPPEDRGVFEAIAFELFRFLTEKGFEGSRHGDLAMAINFRLTALARLVQGDQVRGWTLPGDTEGLTYLHADVLKAAAKEPLVEDDKGQAAFDGPAFAQHVLSLAAARGRA